MHVVRKNVKLRVLPCTLHPAPCTLHPAKTMKKFLISLLLISATLSSQNLREYHFRAGDKEPRLTLHNGAELTPEGYLRLNGLGAYAELTETKDLVLSDRGLTIIAIIRPAAWKDSVILSQAESYSLATTATGRYTLSTHWAQNPSAGFVSGKPSGTGRNWDFLVASIERNLNTADGINGYRFTLAVNGEYIAQREINNLAVTMRGDPILLGKGKIPFAGDIAGLHIYRRQVPESEIQKLIQECGVTITQTADGNRRNAAALAPMFTELAAKTTLPEAKWLLDSLKDYAANETSADEFGKFLEKSISAFEAKNAPDMVKSWNQDSRDIRILETPQILMLLSLHGTGTPFLGAFNRTTGTVLFPYDGFSWGMEFENMQGESFLLSPLTGEFAYDIRQDKHSDSSDEFTVTWKRPEFTVTMPVKLAGTRLEASLKVVNHSGEQLLTNIIFPRTSFLRLPGKNDGLVIPRFSGCKLDNPTNDLLAKRWGYPRASVTMQMTTYYDDQENGIYLAIEDPLTKTKFYSVRGSSGRLSQEWLLPVPFMPDAKSGGNSFDGGDAKAIVEIYRGDWYEAGQIYKRFLTTTPFWIPDIPRTSTPEWFRNNALWVMGFDPSSGTMPIEGYRYLNEYFELPVSHVSGILSAAGGRWRFGPDFIPRKDADLPNTLKEIHEMGSHVLPYFNCRLWYCGDTAEDENQWSKRGKPWAVHQRDGSVVTENYGATGIHAVMCPSTKAWSDKIMENVIMIAEAGIDGVYHDQLPCGANNLCYSTDHGHLPGDPAAWCSQGHWITYEQRIQEELRKKYPDFVHTGEEGSDPYLKCLDGYMTWRFGHAGHVPLFQSIYVPRIQFVGRGCFTHTSRPCSYESFYPKYGEQLIFGEQIGWVQINSLRYPSPMRAWLKKLALLRQALAPFMNSSEMQKMLKFQEPPEQLTTHWGVVPWENVNTTDKILHSVWKHSDGRVLVMFLNTVAEDQTVKPIGNIADEKYLTVLSEGQDARPVKQGTSLPSVTLKPYEFRMWLLSKQPPKEWAESLLPVMKKIATVMDDLGLYLNQPVDFTARKELDASKHEFIRIKDASWLLGANRFVATNLDFDPKAKPDNWAVATPDSVIYFGSVNFGEHAAVLEGEFAAYKPGVTVEVVNLTRDQPHEIIATFQLTPGGWYEYKTVLANTIRPLHGKLDIIFRVKGGNCNFKGWRIKE